MVNSGDGGLTRGMGKLKTGSSFFELIYCAAMDKVLHNDGKDYLRKETILALHEELRTLDGWLVRRPPSKTLDLVYGLRLFLTDVAVNVFMKFDPRTELPEGLRDLIRKGLADKKLRKKHLMKRPCEATGVNYDTLIEHCTEIFGELP